MTTQLDPAGSPWYSALHRRPHAFHALRSDPRFSYTLHAPRGFFTSPQGHGLIVVTHGSGRSVAEYRSAFGSFADEHRCVVLCPLFPMGVRGNGYADGYKNILEGDIRYDEVLLAMIAELEEAAEYSFGRFHLFGFSGGGQYAHRFFYLHPRRLASVSIGAPGMVTRIDSERDWWFGTRDLQTVFGTSLSLKDMRRVPVQMIVGAEDVEDPVPARLRPLIETLGPVGRDRIERLQLLKENYEENGIAVRMDLVPDVGHEGLKVIPTVLDFLRLQVSE
ncbi:hypothetical protein C7413_116136 [Paraburkholderia silvatlantica]|nr:hypothetical protein C7411_117136 [Paraburkholderia silvatlantica]PXW35012.1 hypothetical protein C7413_116136 [Paraburkholderia silvatlantica]TDQ98919.1 hypothetical protein C7412_104136 [Paraburkholderia silvatlantica]